MTDIKTFDDTSPFKEEVLGDKPNTHEVVIANTSEIKNFYDPLTHIRFELKTETTVRIKGDLAHKQFLANIEQINTLNGSTQLVVSSDTNIDDSGNAGGGTQEEIRVTGVTVTPKTKTMTPFTTANLTANIQPSNATKQGLAWVSDNPDVVKVDQSGALRAVAVGKANVTVTTDGGGYTATTKVTVKSEGASVTVKATNDKTTFAYNETTQLTATITPDTVTDKSVTWESSDTAIATVDANGLVTGVATGTVTITATSVSDSTNSGSIDLNLVTPS